MAFEQSTIHANTVKKTNPQNSKGLFYHSQYEIENFIQTYQDSGNGDPFKVLNDPTWTGFKLFFHFDAESGLLADESYQNSALAFLKRTGQNERYDLLKRFITVLSRVNSVAPWIFQEISGLGEIWSKKRSEPRYESTIDIKCLETIDNKMMSLVKMYRDISFDEDRWVWVLPVNLRKWSMSVYIYDFRMFDNSSTTAKELLQTLENTDVKKLNHVLFDCGHCQFTEDSGKAFFSSITNNQSEFSSTNLSIFCESVTISGLFKSITGDLHLTASAFELAKTSTTGLLTYKQEKKYVDRLKERVRSSGILKTVEEQYNNLIDVENWKRQLKNVRDDASESLIQRAETALTGLYLGNIYGFGFDDLARLKQTGSYRSTFNQIYSQNSTTKSLANGNNTIDYDNLGKSDGVNLGTTSTVDFDRLGNIND